MIRHIVFFNAKDPKDRDRVEQGLKMLAATPHARFFEIGRNLNQDAISEPVDFVVYGEFDDEAALAAYKADPLYQRSIEAVRPIRELRIAADFKSAAAAIG
ncbi:Dabb family protein [uncultured Hoeflea sp.]|uniref:Dabb family protein n=1 Tax=uncultured Hoeflea sp. TaxID=538666 RepID=UPI0030D78C45|tara:strand:+ start:1117 stop:1419 length:303 start_codon:yes stop_codon:yes gene_type:complete